MQDCRSQCNPDPQGPQTPRAPQPRQQHKKSASGASIQWIFEGRVCEREPWSKPWQGKHTLSDSLQHPSFTSYNKGFTISLQHKMAAETALKKLFHGNRHHSWRWCMENERHRYALTCSSFPLTHWPRLLSSHCQKQFL